MMRYLPIFFLSLVLSSCSVFPCKETVECGTLDYMQPSFIGFAKTEIDTFEIKWYERGSGFTTLIRSTLYDSATLMTTPALHGGGYPPDSVFFPLTDSKTGRTYYLIDKSLLDFNGDREANDVEIIVPATGNIYRITDIAFEGDKSKKMEYDCSEYAPTCRRALKTLKINGKEIQYPNYRFEK